MSVPSSRVARVAPPPREPVYGSHVDVERVPESVSVSERCDLRGLRVDEALDRADAHLQRALGTSLRRVLFVHGHGTGALKKAVRDYVAGSRYVVRHRAGGPGEGGDGVTVVWIR